LESDLGEGGVTEGADGVNGDLKNSVLGLDTLGDDVFGTEIFGGTIAVVKRLGADAAGVELTTYLFFIESLLAFLPKILVVFSNLSDFCDFPPLFPDTFVDFPDFCDDLFLPVIPVFWMAAVRAVIGFNMKRFVGDCGVRGKGSCRKLSLRAELIGEEAFIEGTVFGIITGSGILDKRRFRRAVIFNRVITDLYFSQNH
jgi:hypothetical protein